MATALVRPYERARLLAVINQLSFRVYASLTTHQAKLDKSQSLGRPFNEIPGPRGLPFIGSLFDIMKEGGSKNMHRISERRFEKYGSIHKDTMFGTTIININDASAAETLLRADGKNPNRPELLPFTVSAEKTGLPITLFNLKGEEGKRIRRAFAPKLMLPKPVHENMDNFNRVTGDLIRRLETLRSRKDSVIVVNDMIPHLTDWSTESICTFVFDTRFGLFENPPRQEAKTFVHLCDMIQTEFLPKLSMKPPAYFRYITTPVLRKLVEAFKVTAQISENIMKGKLREWNTDINAKTQPDISGPSVLSYILSRKKDLTAAEISLNMRDFFGAGVDTTALTANWLLYHLAKNPDAQEKPFQEVDPLLKKTDFLSAEDISKVPYLKASLKESQRLLPIAQTITRITQENLVLCGYQIPAGTLVNHSNYAAGRCEKYFEEAEKFKPERWLRGEGEKITPYAFLPFGQGPRMCIGRRVAEVEIYSLVSKMIAKFKVRQVDNEDVNSLSKLFLVPEKPIGFVLIERV